ncbi:MAG TPA: hypothetical protein VEP29_00100 [Desulfatiglandales bacterium]|nr:hypothetical protein [Desulfatiglandales bacterium]
MKELFEDILAMEDVRGVVILSSEGEILFAEPSLEVERSLPLFIRSLGTVREADLIFEKSRIYVRRTDMGYLVILLGLFASGAMLRLHVDMVLPSLKDRGKGKGLRSLFKRNK